MRKKLIDEIDLCDFVGPKPVKQRSKEMYYPSVPGVYALMCGDIPYYIGMSSNISKRLQQHKHYFPAIVFPCDESTARQIEMRLVGKYNPPNNTKLRSGNDGVVVESKAEPIETERPQFVEPPMLEGFKPIEFLWAGEPKLFPSKYSALWFIDRYRDELVEAKAVAIHRRKKYVRLEALQFVKAAVQ